MTSPDQATLEQLKASYEAAIRDRSIDDLLRYGEAYFDKLRGGSMLPEDRETLQHQIWSIKAQNPLIPDK